MGGRTAASTEVIVGTLALAAIGSYLLYRLRKISSEKPLPAASSPTTPPPADTPATADIKPKPERPPRPPFGVYVTRALENKEVELLNAVWNYYEPWKLLEKQADTGRHELCWLNLYQDGRWLHKFGDRQTELSDFCDFIAREQCPYYANLHYTSISLVMAPPGCHTQFWHVDYSGHETNISLTMTPWTKLNGMEYMKGDISPEDFDHFRKHMTKANQQGDGTEEYRSNAGLKKIAAEHGMTNISLHQAVVDAGVIARMSPGTVHRGITNRGDTLRYYFLIVADEKPLEKPLVEEGAVSEKMELSAFVKLYGGALGNIEYEPAEGA